MSFLAPALFIAGLLAVAVPIIIHLLSRRRRRPIEWAAMRFLIDAIRRQRRRLQIEQLILLALRCLILAVLGFALARPILEQAGVIGAGSRQVVLVIDNGLISQSETDDGPAFETTVADAKAIVESLEPGDAVAVVTAARPARGAIVPASTDHGGVIKYLESLTPSAAPTDFNGAFAIAGAAAQTAIESGARPSVFVLSEFRRGAAALDAPLPEAFAALGDAVTLYASDPAEASVSNVQIAAIEPLRRFVLADASDVASQITVRLRRTGGDMDREVSRVRLTGDGLTGAGVREVVWEPGAEFASAEFIVSYDRQGRDEIGLTAAIDNDRLNADNTRHAVLALRDRIRAVLVDRRSFGFDPSLEALSAGQWLRRALEPFDDGPVELIDVEPEALAAADLRAADVVLLPRPDLIDAEQWTLVRTFVDRGGLAFVTPPADVNVHQWTERFVRAMDLPWRLAMETVMNEEGLTLADDQPESELLRLIASDMKSLVAPIVTVRTLPLDGNTEAGAARPVLTFADGSPFMVATSPGGGTEETETPDGDAPARRALGLIIYIATAPQLTWSNLPSKPLMVPLFHETIRQGLSLARSAGDATVGDQPALGAPPTAVELVASDGAATSIALDANGRPDEAFAAAGVYELRDGAGQRVGLAVANVDVNAGRTAVQSPNAVKDWLARAGEFAFADRDAMTAALATAETGSPLAAAALWLLLVLVVIETILARWFSHAYVRDRAAGLGGSVSQAMGLTPTLTLRSTTSEEAAT